MKELCIVNAVKEELEKRGYKVTIKSVTKNGVTKMGVVVGEENICPTFYPY